MKNLTKLQSWWKSLSRRDQGLFSVWLGGMLVAAIVGLWSVLSTANARAHVQLSTELKNLQQMRVRAEEMQQLKQLPPAGSQLRGINPETLVATLAKFSIPIETIQATDNPEQTGFQGVVPFDKWVEWLAFVQKDMHLLVVKAKIKPTERAGLVEVQATLELQKD